MKSKTKEAYIDLFNYIINEVDNNWYPDTVSIDFEKAAIGAIQDVFPRTRIFGCWFLQAQSIYRNVQHKGQIIRIINSYLPVFKFNLISIVL